MLDDEKEDNIMLNDDENVDNIDDFEENIEKEESDKIIEVNLASEMKNSFLSYAMSVIVARALPDVRDGLKPVHRKILYAMNELGNYYDRPHKKSARIVGDVIGKYHPHGDTPVYEAMVRMAQAFSYRYPLVDGQGNFGSIDGDGAAAQRYTEARMSKIAAEMLRDLNKNTVNFQENYDGSEMEPEILPSKYPNILVNGATGIAVGMATNIPPHNLSEIIDGVIALMENKDITIDELNEYIKGPDFPTGAIIIGTEQIKKAYKTGMGSIVVRAKIKVNELKNGKKELIVTEIPYQLNKTKLIERIAEVAGDKRIDGITDLRDESSRKGMKIIIETRRDVNVDVLLNNLYKHTQLQSTFGINMIALKEGQPKLLNLKEILECYLAHQEDVITRRTQFDLNKAEARMHIIEGLLIALANIDDVVHTIKNSMSPDEALNNLVNGFNLTVIQAKAILEMRLQRLTGLEVEKLEKEKQELIELIERLNSILSNHDVKLSVIKEEILELKNKYGDARRTLITEKELVEVTDEDLIDEEDVIITITNKGYIKRLNADTYRSQKRGGKGITGTKMQEDDFVEKVIYTSTQDNLLFFSGLGNVYIMNSFQANKE